MKDYSNNQRIAKASSALLGLLMLAGLVMPMKADYRL